MGDVCFAWIDGHLADEPLIESVGSSQVRVKSFACCCEWYPRIGTIFRICKRRYIGSRIGMNRFHVWPDGCHIGQGDQLRRRDMDSRVAQCDLKQSLRPNSQIKVNMKQGSFWHLRRRALVHRPPWMGTNLGNHLKELRFLDDSLA